MSTTGRYGGAWAALPPTGSTARCSRFAGVAPGLIKLLWHDGVGLCMLTKRLEQDQFIWPSATSNGRIALSPS